MELVKPSIFRQICQTKDVESAVVVIHRIKIGTSVIHNSKVKGLRHQKETASQIKQLKQRIAQKPDSLSLSLRKSAIEPKVMALCEKMDTQILRGVQKHFTVIQNVNHRKTVPFNLPTVDKG